MAEHYEITRYGALIAWARDMGRNDFADILAENLAEERDADEKLNKLAEGRVNAQAAGNSTTRKKKPAQRKAPRKAA